MMAFPDWPKLKFGIPVGKTLTIMAGRSGVGKSIFSFNYHYNTHFIKKEPEIVLFPKNRKNRKGKPHWTEARIVLSEHPDVRANLLEAYQEHLGDSTEYPPARGFWEWCAKEIAPLGARVVYDLRYEQPAIQVDDDVTKVALLLRWGGAQP